MSPRRPRVAAIVPARGGSKGVPRKNLRVVAGHSLLARAVETARDASSVEFVVVSTDDDEIEAAARSLGVTVVRRPPELGSDTAPMAPVLLHAVTEACLNDFDVVVLLQPPSPIRTGRDVDAAVELLTTTPKLDSVTSVYQVGDDHPGRMYTLGNGAVLRPLFAEWESLRRQDLPAVYHRNGAIYAVRLAALKRTGEVLAGDVGAYVMDPSLTANIDTERDIPLAEILVRDWESRRGVVRDV